MLSLTETLSYSWFLRDGKFFRKCLTLYFSLRIERIKSMIHNNSNDPVLIRKISLKIWSLRDEIESKIQEKLEAGTSDEELDLTQIKEQYTPKKTNSNNVLSLKSNSSLDSSEDEMAKAMAGGATEESTPTEKDKIASDSQTSSNVVAIDQNTISVELKIPNVAEEKISKGKTVLSEIGMDKMFFFCNKSFTEGQSIVIQFCIPNSFIVNADVLYCRPFNLKSRIISQNNFTHRVLIRFNFLKEGERALLRQFIHSIGPDLSKYAKKDESAKSETDSGGLGSLDDLGL